MSLAERAAPLRQFDLRPMDPEIVHPDVFFTWCFGRELGAEIARNEAVNEHLLLISLTYEINNRFREKRFFVKDANQCINTIRFYTPGPHTVRAVLVSVPRGGVEANAVRHRFLHGYDGTFDYSYPDENATLDDYAVFVSRISKGYATFLAAALTDVNIPEGIHGKPPHPLLKKWAMAYSPRKLDDECDFGRRLLYAFTVQLVQYPLWEGLKRLMVMLIGLWQMFLGREGEDLFVAAVKPEMVYTWPKYEIYQLRHANARPLFHELPGVLLHPVIVTFFVVYGASWYVYLTKDAHAIVVGGANALVVIQSILLIAIAVIVAGAFIDQGLKALRRTQFGRIQEPKPKTKAVVQKETAARLRQEEERKQAQKRAEQILAGELVPMSVCTENTNEQERAKKLLKKAPINLQVVSAKRGLCRPFVNRQ